MRKMSTLFKVEYIEKGTSGSISDEVRVENSWVFTEPNSVKITVKFDGTACAIIKGVLHKRYDAKHGKQAPVGAIPCGDADPISGHHPHWVVVDAGKSENKYFLEAMRGFMEGRMRSDLARGLHDGTFELCGERVGINAEQIKGHVLIRHGSVLAKLDDMSFSGIRDYLETHDVEGIVFHHDDGRMCKIRKTDFGFKRGGL